MQVNEDAISPEAEAIGHRVKEAMFEANIDVQKVADHFGVAIQTVYRWMTGQSEPSRERLAELGKMTGHQLLYFYTERAYKTSRAVDLIIDQNGKELVRIRIDSETTVSIRLSPQIKL